MNAATNQLKADRFFEYFVRTGGHGEAEDRLFREPYQKSRTPDCNKPLPNAGKPRASYGGGVPRSIGNLSSNRRSRLSGRVQGKITPDKS